MAKSIVNASASAGFMSFDIVDFQDMWTNLRDGNYWYATKKAISILNSILNFNAVGGSTVKQFSPEIGENVDDGCTYLEQWVQDANADPDAVMAVRGPKRVGADNGPEIDIASVIAIVNLVLTAIREWRKRRSAPTESGQPAISQRQPDGRPLEPARPTQPATSNPNANADGTMPDTGSTPAKFNENPAKGDVTKLFSDDNSDNEATGPAEGDNPSPDKRDEGTNATTGGKVEAPAPKLPPATKKDSGVKGTGKK